MKFQIIKEEENVYIQPATKTEWINKQNGHKYLNDLKENQILLQHKRQNWKNITQFALERIQLPSGATSLSGVQLNELTLWFIDNQEQVWSLPLTEAIGVEATEQLFKDNLLALNHTRTGYPVSYENYHIFDFVATVLYELYYHIREVDDAIMSAQYPRSILLGENNYQFNIIGVHDDDLIVTVKDNTGAPVDTGSWSYNPSTSKLNINGIETEIQVAATTNKDEINNEELNETVTITGINCTDDKLTITTPEDTFHTSRGAILVILELSTENSSIRVPVTHQCRLLDSLGMPLGEDNTGGNGGTGLPVIDPSITQRTITIEETADNSADVYIPLGTTIQQLGTSNYFKCAYDENGQINIYGVDADGVKEWLFDTPSDDGTNTYTKIMTTVSKETDAESLISSAVYGEWLATEEETNNNSQNLTPHGNDELMQSFQNGLTEYVNAENIRTHGLLQILPTGGGVTLKTFIFPYQIQTDIPDGEIQRIYPVLDAEDNGMQFYLYADYIVTGSGGVEDRTQLKFDTSRIHLKKAYNKTTNKEYKSIKYLNVGEDNTTDHSKITFMLETDEDIESKINEMEFLFYQEDNGYILVKGVEATYNNALF